MGPPGPTGWPLRGGGGGARVWLDCCPVPPSQTDPPHSAEPQRLTPGPTRSARARGRTSNFGEAQIPMALAFGRTPAVSVDLGQLPPKAPKGGEKIPVWLKKTPGIGSHGFKTRTARWCCLDGHVLYEHQ